MITIIGIIIFAIPFIFVGLFKDKLKGFLFIFTASFFLHLIVALTTQSIHAFNYPTIITVYSLISIVSICVYVNKKPDFKNDFGHFFLFIKEKFLSLFKKTGRKNIFVLAVFVIVFFNLFSVHYNYSGTVNSYKGEYDVKKSPYIYPYFSDEWVAVSFIKYEISHNSLPIVNPLDYKESFKDPLVPYFSFIGDEFLFFGLDPLNNFEAVTLIVGLTICILFFALLSSLGVDRRISALTVLIIPYITNGGNLPGIWILIPMIFSLTFYLISLIAIVRRDYKLLFISSLLCLCLYPPFVVFVVPTLIPILFVGKKGIRDRLLLFFSTVFVVFFIIGFIIFDSFNMDYIWKILDGYLFRSNLVAGILIFPIWHVVPVLVLPVALLGLVIAFKRKLYFIILPLFTGLFYWYCYTNTQRVFIIDFPRIVVITSFLSLIPFALLVHYLFDPKKRESQLNILTFGFIVIAIIFAFSYTENNAWRELKLHYNKDPEGLILIQATPANRFLTEDDLRLFNGITSKTFISPPWKGLVIGSATGNFPLASKPSTIGVFTLNYDEFLGSNCKDKQKTAIENKIDYVYSTKFDCLNFTVMGTSSEGLILYQFSR